MDAGWEEVERMASAANAADALISFDFPSEETIARWRKLFSYTRREALILIAAQRSDVTRNRISDEHWSLVREQREAQGHDRETYEHNLRLVTVISNMSATIPWKDGKNIVLIRLGGLLGSAEKVKEIAGLTELPKVMEGMSEMGLAKFAMVDEEAKKKVDEWLLVEQAIEKSWLEGVPPFYDMDY